MRWLVVPLALCAAGSVTYACPMLDFARIAAGGEVVGRREVRVDGGVYRALDRRVPAQPTFYLHLPAHETRLPVFEREDGSRVPTVVTATNLDEYPLAITLLIDSGTVSADRYTFDRFIVGATVPRTRSITRDLGDVTWQVDSDAALFRMTDAEGLEYASEDRELWVAADDGVVAIYPDGREELLVAGGHPVPRPASQPWWLLALAPALLLWPLCRRSVALEV